MSIDHFNSQNWKTLFGVNDIGDPLQINDAWSRAINQFDIIQDIEVRTNYFKRKFHDLNYAAKFKLFLNAHFTNFYGTNRSLL